MTSVPDRLTKAAEIYRERNKLYGDNYKNFGRLMTALFPKGVNLNTPELQVRYGLIVQIMTKTSRYAESFLRGGHADSCADASVYWQMLAEVDAEINMPNAFKNPNVRVPKYREGQEVWYQGNKSTIRHIFNLTNGGQWYVLTNGATIKEESLDANQSGESYRPEGPGVGPGEKVKPHVPRRRNGRRVRRSVQRRQKAGA